MHFRDRRSAGKELAQQLRGSPYVNNTQSTIVLALPRGGVPVAFEIAQNLQLPLDLVMVRKLGVPGNEELALGAIADNEVCLLNQDIIRHLSIPDTTIKKIIVSETRELQRRRNTYCNGQPRPTLRNKTVILVDDGCATGANMRAAIQSVSRQGVNKIVVAVPVISEDAYKVLYPFTRKIVYLILPTPFFGVGHFYQDFSQTSDAEVTLLLSQASLKKDTV